MKVVSRHDIIVYLTYLLLRGFTVNKILLICVPKLRPERMLWCLVFFFYSFQYTFE